MSFSVKSILCPFEGFSYFGCENITQVVASLLTALFWSPLQDVWVFSFAKYHTNAISYLSCILLCLTTILFLLGCCKKLDCLPRGQNKDVFATLLKFGGKTKLLCQHFTTNSTVNSYELLGYEYLILWFMLFSSPVKTKVIFKPQTTESPQLKNWVSPLFYLLAELHI